MTEKEELRLTCTLIGFGASVAEKAALEQPRTCPQCAGTSGTWTKFCGFCGAENPCFSEEAFLRVRRHPRCLFLEGECGRGHPFYKRDGFVRPIQQCAQAAQAAPYCDVCGERLD